MKKPTKLPKSQKQQDNQKNISQEVHQEASRIAKNLMRLPPQQKKQK